MWYMPKYFAVQELVPRHVYDERGEAAWELLDPLLLESIDAIRQHLGPATINNWHTGGNRQWSGFRSSRSPYGGQYSQHRFGRAADMLFRDVPPNEARQFVMDNPGKFPLITGIELDVNWLHVDVRHTQGIKTFKP